jgi:hypothetical protein
MRALLALIIVFAPGCAFVDGLVETFEPALEAGKEILNPALEKLPEAMDIVQNNPGMGGLVEAGILLAGALLMGGGVYAKKKLKGRKPDAPKPE